MSNMTTTIVSKKFFAIKTDYTDYFDLAVSEEGELKQGLILARNTETGKCDLYARDGENGLNNPRFILYANYNVDAAAVAAGSISVAAMVAGAVRSDLISTAAGDEINYLETDGLNTNNITCFSTKNQDSTDI